MQCQNFVEQYMSVLKVALDLKCFQKILHENIFDAINFYDMIYVVFWEIISVYTWKTVFLKLIGHL